MYAAFAQYHSDAPIDAEPTKPNQHVAAESRRAKTPAYHAPESVEHFLAQVEQPLYRYAYRFLKCEQDALEAVQETLLKWVEKKYSRKPVDAWRPLVYRILQNHLYDIKRRQRITGGIIHIFNKITFTENTRDLVESAPASPHQEPERQKDQDAFITALMNALEALPKRQRQAFEYRVGEGLSTRETAIAMGCGEGSVMTHLSRANQALRKALRAFHDIH